MLPATPLVIFADCGPFGTPSEPVRFMACPLTSATVPTDATAKLPPDKLGLVADNEGENPGELTETVHPEVAEEVSVTVKVKVLMPD